MGKRIYINDNWLFQPDYQKELINFDYDTKTFEKIRIPHTNVLMPLNYFDESIYQKVSGY